MPKSKPLPALKSRDEAEAAVALVAALTIQLDLELAEHNSKLLAARQHDGKIQDLQEKLEARREQLEAWARANRKELFADLQTLPMRQGELVFQWGKRRVEFLRGWTEEVVLQEIRRLGKRCAAIAECVRTSYDIHKARLLEYSSDDCTETGPKLTEDQLKSFGVRIEREERFRVEPKLEQAPP